MSSIRFIRKISCADASRHILLHLTDQRTIRGMEILFYFILFYSFPLYYIWFCSILFLFILFLYSTIGANLRAHLSPPSTLARAAEREFGSSIPQEEWTG